nr:probable inactive receptor kinase At5g53320 [Physcomitrium patens]|eukprot:XP_024362277.1 probable inactive receptor kinase At5g53320 [Physcomitrella patens]
MAQTRVMMIAVLFMFGLASLCPHASVQSSKTDLEALFNFKASITNFSLTATSASSPCSSVGITSSSHSSVGEDQHGASAAALRASAHIRVRALSTGGSQCVLDAGQQSVRTHTSSCNCVRLTTLNLGNNTLSGNIPSQSGKLVNLDRFVLSYNQLTGPIPAGSAADFCDPTLLESSFLDLSNNRLNGSIPTTIGECVLLVEL